MRIAPPTFLVLAAAGTILTTVQAADWPQYRGPKQDGISTETMTFTWSAGAPKQLWKVPTQNGFSSFAVSDGKAFTLVNRDVVEGTSKTFKEILIALDAQTGKELWFAETGPGRYDGGGDDGADGNKGGNGPRSTPTINGGKVYVFGQHMVAQCFDEATGKPLWSRDLLKEHAGRPIAWKNAMSPVIEGDLVYVAGGGAGQSILALNKNTGEVVWKGFDETTTHGTPVIATIQGERQVIFFLKSGLLSVSAKEGKELWRFPFRFNVSTAISPVVCGDIVYCSAGYGVGGGACRITKTETGFTATQLYKIGGDEKIANHWSTPVYKDGYLYGMFSFKKYATGPMKCVDVATGEIKWEQPGFGAGNVILVEDKIVALSDDGQLVVAEAKPEAYKEISRAKVVEGKCWTTPALSNGRLYVRSTKEGVCLDVSAK